MNEVTYNNIMTQDMTNSMATLICPCNGVAIIT